MSHNTDSVISQNNQTDSTMVLTYTIQKIVSFASIENYTLKPVEIETAIDKLMSDNAPEDGDILDCDYSWFGNSQEPIPKGCEPEPTDDCWVNVNGVKWATNSWCIVTNECPPINNKNIWNIWHRADEVSKALPDFFLKHQPSNIKHTGFFDKRFLPLKNIPNMRVYGARIDDPGFCFVDNQLIAVIMPIDKKADTDCTNSFQFNSEVV
jgi:hypothetical protein